MTGTKDNIVIANRMTPQKKAFARELRRRTTISERLLWPHLRANRLLGLHFRRQQVIDGYIVDFYCHSEGLVIELDGSVHLGQEEYDDKRDAHLESRGLKVLRFSNNKVENELSWVLSNILSHCRPEALSGVRFAQDPTNEDLVALKREGFPLSQNLSPNPSPKGRGEEESGFFVYHLPAGEGPGERVQSDGPGESFGKTPPSFTLPSRR